MLGDIVDSKGQKSNYRQMLTFFKELKTPILFALGNHETAYRIRFQPDYDLSPFTNYFNAQRQVNNMPDLLCYSFDAGNWHIIIWPDPLRHHFWETHPHYFDWLERDLEKNHARPTLFFQHVPIHPIGINPFLHYIESVYVRRKLLDILAKHGNVKYIISGHVHIPVKASIKTARLYRGMKLLNVPPAGFRPRGFGEADYFGGPSQGIAIVELRGDEATVKYQMVTGETFNYPAMIPEFNSDDHPLWLNEKWRLRAEENFVNGEFEDGFSGWNKRFVYDEDVEPSNICEIRPVPSAMDKALYLYCRERGYDAPGQDRLAQSVNRIAQAVKLAPESQPVIRFKYQTDPKAYHPDNRSGAMVWIEGYHNSHKMTEMIYSIGKTLNTMTSAHGYSGSIVHYDLPAAPGRWYDVALNIKTDHERHAGAQTFDALQIDRLALTLAVWTVNEGENQEIGVYFDDFRVSNESILSRVDNNPVQNKQDADIWRKVLDHVAGEHKFVDEK
jgi:hypothetical protein